MAARSSIGQWRKWYLDSGIDGLKGRLPGRPKQPPRPDTIRWLHWLLRRTPDKLGYVTSRWTSRLLAAELNGRIGRPIAASTIRKLLRRMGYRWRRARPTLFRRDPHKAEKLAAIADALENPKRHKAVFFVDEADVDFNPRIGATWSRRGKQVAVETPGQNQKRYVAGALGAHSGQVTFVESERKNSELFIALLEALRRRYRSAKEIVVICDNVITHKSKKTNKWLSKNPKFVLLFQPVYHPWVNRIERLWKQMHETVTCNHRWPTMDKLMVAVRCFLQAVSPFPGSPHGLARLESAV